MLINGYVHKFGDNIDTDVIIPARYCTTIDKDELAKVCMKDTEEDFYMKVNTNDVIVAGQNCGCGSSREVAPLAIQACGLKCVIAKSFSRIFYRNAINIGLMLLINDKIYDLVKNGDEIMIDFKDRNIKIKNHNSITFNKDNAVLIDEIIKDNGLMNYIKNRNFLV
jgi:3-isopropylmalate/(R)-2-methylmalate dehydratase small subunit